MIEPPIAIGLHLCERIIVEEGTQAISIIGMFSIARCAEFPTLFPGRSYAYAALTNGFGNVKLS